MQDLRIDTLSRKAKRFFIGAHEETRHLYEEGVPYIEHLQLTADIVAYFAPLCGFNETETEIAVAAAWGHDSVSDARLTFNNINKALRNERVAQLCCNLCEDVWGKNRDERNSPGYYRRLTSDILSILVKLADRAANIEWGLYFDGSDMPITYLVEMLEFYNKLERDREKFPEESSSRVSLEPMWKHLLGLCETAESKPEMSQVKANRSLKKYGSAVLYKEIFNISII